MTDAATESVLLLKHGKPVRYGRCVICDRFSQKLTDRVWCPACEWEFKQLKRFPQQHSAEGGQ